MFLPHQYLASIDDVVIGKVDVIKGLVVTNPHPVDNNILKELRLALKRVFHLHRKHSQNIKKNTNVRRVQTVDVKQEWFLTSSTHKLWPNFSAMSSGVCACAFS